MPRPRKYSNEAILNALAQTHGAVYLAAARLGCWARVIYFRARSVPAIDALIKAERGKLLDTAELKLYSAVQNGEPWAVQMCLRTLGKDRGYTERIERKDVTDEEIDAAIDGELLALSRGRLAPPGPGGNG